MNAGSNVRTLDKQMQRSKDQKRVLFSLDGLSMSMIENKRKERRVDVSMDLLKSRPGAEDGLLVLPQGKSMVDQLKEQPCNQSTGMSEGTTNKQQVNKNPLPSNIDRPSLFG